MDSIPVKPTGTIMSGQLPFSAGFHLEGAKQQLIGAIRARNVTDKQLPIIWILIPVIIYLAGLVVVVSVVMIQAFEFVMRFMDPAYMPTPGEIFAALGLSIAISIIWTIATYVIFAILTYRLVERQNEHFEREMHLRMGILSFLRAAAGTPEKEATISAEIATMNILHSEASGDESRHTAALWALVIGFMWVPIFSVVAIILNLYMFYFLMKEMWDHDRRWHDFMAQTYSALFKLGYSYSPLFGIQRLEKRSFVLYLVLSIITFGFFALYWWYTLLKDPNEHFKYQWYVEDHLTNVIGQK